MQMPRGFEAMDLNTSDGNVLWEIVIATVIFR